MRRWLFASKSVTEGHPNKVCDQISDAILDEILKQDKDARVACETVANIELILITGEITISDYVEFDKVVRQTLREINYGHQSGRRFSYENYAVLSAIEEQSHNVAQGMDRFKESNIDAMDAFDAGDQDMVFGYACNETEEYMPMPISLAHRLFKRLAGMRKDKTLDYLRPDSETQVTLVYEDDKSVAMKNIVMATQYAPEADLEEIRRDIKKRIIKPIIPADFITEDIRYYINTTGRFVLGGPLADVGLTGRGIIVDTYDGYARHGDGAFSGKDPTRVDRPAAYAARYVIENIVAAGLADKCEAGLSHIIGVAKLLSIYMETFGTGKISGTEVEDLVRKDFDLRPVAVIKELDLSRPIYRRTASYGHSGRNDLDLPWERLDKVDLLRK